jgi:predicted TPR repeat methyltransferase
MSEELSPLPVQEMFMRAVGLHQRDRLDEAEELYQRVLRLAPRNANALHFLGVLRHQQGESQEACGLIRKALRIDPQYVGARINLGNVLKEQGNHDQAEGQYRKAIEADSESADAHNNLGAVLRLQKRTSEAISAFRRATELSDRHADAFQNLGNALKSAGQIEEALTAYRRAIEIDPKHCDAHLNLGRALYRFGRLDEATTVYKQWLLVEPDNPVAAHMLTACQGSNVPDRCSDAFVQQSFDSFASSFDEVLERLEYRAPLLIGQAIEKALPAPDGARIVLDAGCGTGLCGTYLKPYSDRLIGVDLSPKMLDKARRLNLYEELLVAELTEHMRRHSQSYDVIVAADTLVYFGNLAPVLEAAAEALTPGGVLVFTLEREDENRSDLGFGLNPHGRYSHSESTVRQLLEQAGFNLQSMEREALRMEIQEPVDGLIVTATLPGSFRPASSINELQPN